jgi:lipid II:glycine glycyltransferase (peptidoglycan interpeptide bridge formation enzyme)
LIKGYNLFAAEKKIPDMNERLLKALRQKGNILFSKVFYKDTDVATHIYIFDEETISLFSSFHNVNFSDLKIRSEANKLLHWEDVTHVKLNGFKKYDWGGVNPIKLPGVSKFKMNFGGETVENFRYIKTSTLIYRLIKLLKGNNG